MNPIYWLWLLLLCPELNNVQRILSANQERIYLHLDKNQCVAGDTIWWKTYITADRLPYVPSTIYYVDLFTENGKLLRDDKCILINGVGEGQITLPDSLKSGNYFLRAHTSYQYAHDSTSSFYAPIAVYNPVGYTKQPHYVLEKPLEDTVDDYDRGISLHSHLIDSGIQCNITAGYPFNRWGRKLTLELKAGRQDPKYIPLVISQEHPRQHIHILLAGVYGNVHLRLLDQHTLLSQERVNVPYQVRDSVTIRYDTLSTDPHGSNLWTVSIKDTSLCNVSISVADADKIQMSPISIVDQANMLDTVKSVTPNSVFAVDDHYLELNGYARDEKGGNAKIHELAAIIHQDSSKSIITIPVHADGSYHYANFIFEDTFHVNFQRNNQKWNAGDVKLFLNRRAIPAFHLPPYYLLKDTTTYEDTAFFQNDPDAKKAAFNQLQHLKTIVIKESYRDQVHRLNNKYCPGEPIMPYYFDLVTDPDPYAAGIIDYCRRNIPGFIYDDGITQVPIYIDPVRGLPITFFLDGVKIDFIYLEQTTWLNKIALIKFDPDVIGDPKEAPSPGLMGLGSGAMLSGAAPLPESIQIQPAGPPSIKAALKSAAASIGPQLHYPGVFIYTRHQEDYKYLPSTMHEISIPGFAKILKFNPGSDKRWTLYWNPYAGNNFKIHFVNNNYTRHFRVTIEGIDEKGDFIHYEEVIPKQSQHD